MPAREFDPGYARSPFDELCRSYPGPDVYPPGDFRVEWGPIFHRGRLDGTARVLVLGQDPGVHENIARRVLVGEVGQRVQGFLAKLGIESSYVMMNAFLYSVYTQRGGEGHKDDPEIVRYRNGWLDALLVDSRVGAVVAFGALADHAFGQWQQTPTGRRRQVAYEHVPHPAEVDTDADMARMLARWNEALRALAPAINPDVERELVLYGEALMDADHAAIPERDLPAGLPAWMRSREPWAVRVGASSGQRRRTIIVTVPKEDGSS